MINLNPDRFFMEPFKETLKETLQNFQNDIPASTLSAFCTRIEPLKGPWWKQFKGALKGSLA